ncbi:MAG TPA: peptidoglycan DD-metalloendopeptidase family protein [Patescibacteria group bacterium]|jgi:murein DD-endopeptidase MepM/ murein hydrolase activator NlpD|nr:peptidoglycan DD-metalloendopeptidase family protein [Patescibacteria group bacterium]
MLTTRYETKTIYKLVILTALIGAITVGFFVFLMSSQIHQASAANDQKDILNDKLRKLQDQINNYQQSIAQTRKQGASLANEISIYDNQIASLELQIQANETQTDDTNLQITELQTQIDRRKVEIEENKTILGQLVVQLAELDDKSFLNIGLGTDNFSSFLDQIQYNRSITQQVYTLVSKIKEIKTKLEVQQEDLKKSLEKLKELSTQLDIAHEALDGDRSSKANLLAQTKGTEKNYQKLLKTSQSEEDKIQAELYNLDAGARQRAGNPTISAKKGVLAWPMDGILTQGYGNTGFTSLGYNFHNGLDLAAPAGKPIYAPADGTVAACNSSDYAYGNWCTIYHTVDTNGGPRDIVTLYGHMRTYIVSPGQAVKMGDLIGYEGNTGNTTRLLYGPDRGYHLHFTVFDRKGYTVTKGAYGDYMVPSGVTYNPLSFLGQ